MMLLFGALRTQKRALGIPKGLWGPKRAHVLSSASTFLFLSVIWFFQKEMNFVKPSALSQLEPIVPLFTKARAFIYR